MGGESVGIWITISNHQCCLYANAHWQPQVSKMQASNDSELQILCRYLQNLPPSLPLPQCSKYNFRNFILDESWVEDEGLEAAVNRELEILFGSRAAGYLILREQGEGLWAVVDVLEQYISQYPESVILKKWVNDITKAAIQCYKSAGAPVSYSKRSM